MPSSPLDPHFAAVAGWSLFDANARVGPSGIHGELALDAAGLRDEMARFGICEALVSHWTAEEYDAEVGNCALQRDLHPSFTPAWAALPDRPSVDALAARHPLAVRLTPGVSQHNFSLANWCAGGLFEYLQEYAVVTLIPRAEIEWRQVAELLESFPRLTVVLLDIGYRADRYMLPLIARFPGLYFDTATYLAHRQLEAWVEANGPERVLFGTRLPLYTPAAALAVLTSARIPDAARVAIAGGNLRGLLASCRNRPKEVPR